MILAYFQSIEDDNKRRVVEGIYNLYYKRMTACALDILKNYHDSQDAVQEVFYNITATYEQFVDVAAPATAALVHIYVRNAAINIYNKNKRHSKVVMLCDNIEDVAKDIVDEYADVQRIVIDNETTAIVSEAVDKLDDMYRDLKPYLSRVKCVSLQIVYKAPARIKIQPETSCDPCFGLNHLQSVCSRYSLTNNLLYCILKMDWREFVSRPKDNKACQPSPYQQINRIPKQLPVPGNPKLEFHRTHMPLYHPNAVLLGNQIKMMVGHQGLEPWTIRL